MDNMFALLALARENNLTVEVSMHNVPVALAVEMVQDGLLDCIERGAANGSNPPTGRYEAPREDDGPRVSAVVFTDGRRASA